MESGEQKAGGYLGAGGVAFCGKVVEGIVGFTWFDEGSRGILEDLGYCESKLQ